MTTFSGSKVLDASVLQAWGGDPFGAAKPQLWGSGNLQEHKSSKTTGLKHHQVKG